MEKVTKAKAKFGRKIQKKRKELGITQEELADRLNSSRRTWVTSNKEGSHLRWDF